MQLEVHGNSLSHNRIKTLKYLSFFVFIDLLLLPYFQFLIMPISLPLVIASFFVLNVKVVKDKFLVLFLIITATIIISIIISFILPKGIENAIVNIKYAIQLITTFSYFFFFSYVIKHINLNIKPILVLFIIWYTICICMFLYNPGYSAEFLQNIYGKLVNSEDILMTDLRFSYIFQDPNTAMYFYLIAISTVLSLKRNSGFFWLLVILSLIILILGQSKGNLFAFALMVIYVIYRDTTDVGIRPRNIVILGLMFLFFTFGFLYYQSMVDENVFVKYSYERLFGDKDIYLEGGGRLEIWKKFVNNFYPLPLGRGYSLFINNQDHSPHSDLLRLLYSYGFIAMTSVVLFIFGKIKNILHLIIPTLIAFSINTLLDEQKLFGLFLSVLAIELGCIKNKSRDTYNRSNRISMENE